MRVLQASPHHGKTAVQQALILTDAPQNCWPAPPPPGYRAEVPPILCGYCPPGF